MMLSWIASMSDFKMVVVVRSVVPALPLNAPNVLKKSHKAISEVRHRMFGEENRGALAVPVHPKGVQ